MSEILDHVGLQKGGLYNHFDSRDALAGEAFEYAADLALATMEEIERQDGSAFDRILRLLSSYEDYEKGFPLRGGCPLLRGSVEGAGGPDWLRERARHAIGRMVSIFERLLAEAKGEGVLRRDVDPSSEAKAIVAALEGSVMLGGIMRSRAPTRDTSAMIKRYLEALRDPQHNDC